MIENKDKALVKSLKGLLSGKTDILDVLKDAQTDREKILCVFLVTVGCEKVLGLDPTVMFDKLLKYKDNDDINKIIHKEFDNKLKKSADKIADAFKDFVETLTPELTKSLNEEFDNHNKKFINDNHDKFVLVRETKNTDFGLEFFTNEADSFDMDICFAKTFETFDEANEYRNKEKLVLTRVFYFNLSINLW